MFHENYDSSALALFVPSPLYFYFRIPSSGSQKYKRNNETKTKLEEGGRIHGGGQSLETHSYYDYYDLRPTPDQRWSKNGDLSHSSCLFKNLLWSHIKMALSQISRDTCGLFPSIDAICGSVIYLEQAPPKKFQI